MDGFPYPFVAVVFVFVFSVLILAALLAYVLWYRSRFLRELSRADDPEVVAAATTADPYSSPCSKELLLYFICLRNQSQNGRALAAVPPIYSFAPAAPGFTWSPLSAISDAKPLPPPPPPPPPPLPPPLPSELGTWRGLHAPGVLLTVAAGEKEEEGEEGAGVSAKEAADEEQNNEVIAEAVLYVTPFSTSSGSTPFYSLRASPLRGTEAEWKPEFSPEADGSGSDEEEFFFPAEENLPPAE